MGCVGAEHLCKSPRTGLPADACQSRPDQSYCLVQFLFLSDSDVSGSLPLESARDFSWTFPGSLC